MAQLEKSTCYHFYLSLLIRLPIANIKEVRGDQVLIQQYYIATLKVKDRWKCYASRALMPEMTNGSNMENQLTNFQSPYINQT